MPPLCPDCGWVLVKQDMVNHVMYKCYNDNCKSSKKMTYPLYAIKGTKPYFTPSGWLDENTPTEREQVPGCKGDQCGHRIQCINGCLYDPHKNTDLDEENYGFKAEIRKVNRKEEP